MEVSAAMACTYEHAITCTMTTCALEMCTMRTWSGSLRAMQAQLCHAWYRYVPDVP